MPDRETPASVTGWLIISVLAVLPVLGALFYSMSVKDQQTAFNSSRAPTKSSNISLTTNTGSGFRP